MEQVSVLETNIGASTSGNSANTQIIFNDNGTLRGDTGLTYDKSADRLSFGAGICYGDLTVRTDKLLVTATGVGVGAVSVNPFDVVSTAGTLAVFKRTGSNGAFIGIQDGSGTGLAYIGYTNGVFSIQTPGSGYADKLSVDTSGNVTVSLGNLVMGTSGKGIDFSATAGTGTSELLNDYEEGTFTATLTGGAGATNPTVPVTTTARYTKVGRLVTVQIEFTNVSTVGASGTLGISGLPFANGSVASSGIATLYGLATFTGSPVVFIDSSASTLVFYGIVSASNYSSVTHNAGVGRYSTTTITYSV